jgi:hypothetical protein
MKLTRILFLALAVLLPTSWTVAHAEEGAAPAEGKKEKKSKKSKKADAEPKADADKK